MTTPAAIWIVGKPDRPEWRAELTWLATARESVRETRVFERLADAALALVNEASPPDLLVIGQARPAEISPAEIESLRRLAPLLPIVQLAGSWCEGELRSGRPWRASQRLYWHQALPRWRDDFTRLAEGRLPAWGLPLTMTEDERFLERLEGGAAERTAPASPGPASETPEQGRLAICANSRAVEAWLMSEARSRGLHPVLVAAQRPEQLNGVVGGIWDGDPSGGEDLPKWNPRSSLAALARWIHPAPVISLLSFPRIEDVERAKAAGAAAVVSKPCLTDDLFAALPTDRCLSLANPQ